jgi:lipopolysaccharide export system permease protein
MKLIDRHLIATFVPPFWFGLGVTTFLLMINVLQNYINLFLEKGIRIDVATEVLILSLGHTIALTVPMATLIGVLMAMGHLASDHEITALKACGISLYRLTLPLLAIGLFLTTVMVAYNQFVLPEGNHRLRNRLFEIHQLRPTLQIKENTFADISDRYTIFVRHKNDRTGRLQDIVLYQREGRGDTTPDVVVARDGHLQSLGPGRIRLDLYNGEMHRIPDAEDPMSYNRTRFSRQSFLVDLDQDGTRLRQTRRRSEREMDLKMLKRAMSEQDSLAALKHDEALGALEEVIGAAYLEQDAATAPPLTPGRSTLDEYRHWLTLTESRTRSLGLNHQVARSHIVKAGKYEVEWHKKFSIPFACTVFILIGVPLAVVSSRGGRGVSIGMSIAAFFLYFVLLSTGEKLADRGIAPPWLAMWLPNLILGTSGVILLRQSVQETRRIDFRIPKWVSRLYRGARTGVR